MTTDNDGPVGPAAFAKRNSRGGRNHRPDQARVDAAANQPRQAPVDQDPPGDRRPAQAAQPREERGEGLLGRARGLFEREKGLGRDPVQEMTVSSRTEDDDNRERPAEDDNNRERPAEDDNNRERPAEDEDNTRPPARDGVVDLEEQFEKSEAGDDSAPREVELMQVGPSVSDDLEMKLNMSSEMPNADIAIDDSPTRGDVADSEVEVESGDDSAPREIEMMQIGPSVSDDPDLQLDMSDSEPDNPEVSIDEAPANDVEFDDTYTRSEDDVDSAASESALRDRLDEIDAERRITRRALSNLRAGRPSPAQSRRPTRQQTMPFLRRFERRWEKRRR